MNPEEGVCLSRCLHEAGWPEFIPLTNVRRKCPEASCPGCSEEFVEAPE
jgi:hypothetical protein